MARPRLPPLNAIKAFEAAARLGSFTRAAEELSVTHGAVSRQIRLLEEWLGTSLFLRTSRNAHDGACDSHTSANFVQDQVAPGTRSCTQPSYYDRDCERLSRRRRD